MVAGRWPVCELPVHRFSFPVKWLQDSGRGNYLCLFSICIPHALVSAWVHPEDGFCISGTLQRINGEGPASQQAAQGC